MKLGTMMNRLLNEVGFGIGLRLFETVSCDNVVSQRVVGQPREVGGGIAAQRDLFGNNERLMTGPCNTLNDINLIG